MSVRHSCGIPWQVSQTASDWSHQGVAMMVHVKVTSVGLGPWQLAIKPTASLFRSSSLVDSSFLRHISPWAFWISSNLANLLAKTHVLGLSCDISPFLSSHEVISGFSGIMLLSLSKHMAIIIVLWFTSKFILLIWVQVKLIGRSELAKWPFCQACPSSTVLWPSPWLALLFPLTYCDITSVTSLRLCIHMSALASSLSVACKLMLKHAKSRIYMGSHATGVTYPPH